MSNTKCDVRFHPIRYFGYNVDPLSFKVELHLLEGDVNYCLIKQITVD